MVAEVQRGCSHASGGTQGWQQLMSLQRALCCTWQQQHPAQRSEGSPSWRQPVLVHLTSSPAIQVLEKQPQDPAAWNNLGNATAGGASRAVLLAGPLDCPAVHVTARGNSTAFPIW